LPKRPNIVTVMVDDLGWNQISVGQSTMGTQNTQFATPNLEMMADNGLSFTHAYAQPNCAPTRAAMLSGQYPARIHNDVYVVNSLNRYGGAGISRAKAKFLGAEQSEDVAPEAITVAEALRENGYATAHIGKYHVGGRDPATLPENVGFDINVGGYSQGHQSTCFASKGKEGQWAFRGLGRGDFDIYGAPYTAEYLAKYSFPDSLLGTPKHVSDAVGDAMEASVKTLHASGKPFYLQLHPYAVHGPVKSRPDLKAAAGGDNLAGFIASIDLITGRLLKAIGDPNGDGDSADSVAANTLILFTSDNGGTHGDNRPLRGKKGMFTEGGVRVPLIAYWPGVIPANTISDHMVHTVDYYPTYLELAGKQWMPPESEHPLDGESFADKLHKPDSARDRGPIFYLFPGYMDVRAQPCAVAIDEIGGKRYKLLYFYEANAWQLYNLSDDIGEATDLINQKPELGASLAKKIDAWLKQEHPTWKPKYPIEKASGEPAGPPVF
ncbi:MAG: arylsulfatase A-like enzyme, partial [Rhodothermales bacterium]